MDHMNREVIQFIQMLGRTKIGLRCDNEPGILQLKRLLLKTRQAMGLRTLESSAVAYDHGNSLAENAVGRVRPLAVAASLMHQLQGRLGIQLSTSSAIWTWALRHAAWLLSRFAVTRGATPYELAFGRAFKGQLCEYGEPVFGYVVPETKASAKWRRMLFLGKAETQDSYILFDGQSILLSRNIRRINTTWRSHMAYYLHCRCFSWQFKTGFGARILPTMKKIVPQQASFALPLEPIEPSKLHDKDAEDVVLHAEDQKKLEQEQQAMSGNDPLNMPSEQRLETLLEDTSADAGGTVQTGFSTSAPMHVEGTNVGAHSKDVVVVDDPGLAIPITPPRDSPGDSPRASSSVRPSEQGSEETLKRQKTEESKRQRINQLKAEYEERLTKVKLAYREYFTVDDYSTELDVAEVPDDDIWAGEDSVKLPAVPDALWSDAAIEKTPTEAPEKWIDDMADKLEIQRLTQMQVLVTAAEFEGAITGKLTTRLVRDWRLKDFGEGPSMRKRWMRRCRLVAREFNNSKRLDTFSPATGAYTNNLLPIKYLWMKCQALEMPTKEECEGRLPSSLPR